jgi:AraC-like DNA-binding protein
MNPHFIHKKGQSNSLEHLPHIVEVCSKKISSIVFNSFTEQTLEYLTIYCIKDGRFEWIVNGKEINMLPGDTLILWPGAKIGSNKGFYDIGTLSWISLNIQSLKDHNIHSSEWKGITEEDGAILYNFFTNQDLMHLPRYPEAGNIISHVGQEMLHQEVAYLTRVNHLIAELLISIVRFVSKQTVNVRDFPKVFMQLEQTLRQKLQHQWTVEEMATLVGMGTTLFNERVKNFSGFTPLNYLINIRITEAIKLLKRNESSISEISLNLGFYSSQHFSTTFKKLTGYTPGEFRKMNSKTD